MRQRSSLLPVSRQPWTLCHCSVSPIFDIVCTSSPRFARFSPPIDSSSHNFGAQVSGSNHLRNTGACVSELCVPVASASGGQHLRSASTGLVPRARTPNHDRPTELRCRGTISVEQSSCHSTETRDDSTHFQATTVRPICSTSDVLANRRNIHHRPCGVFVILRRIQNCRLTYLLTVVSGRSCDYFL